MGTLTLALTTVKTQASLLPSLSQAILDLLERAALVSPRDLSYVSNKPFHTLSLCLCVWYHHSQYWNQTGWGLSASAGNHYTLDTLALSLILYFPWSSVTPANAVVAVVSQSILAGPTALLLLLEKQLYLVLDSPLNSWVSFCI